MSKLKKIRYNNPCEWLTGLLFTVALQKREDEDYYDWLKGQKDSPDSDDKKDLVRELLISHLTVTYRFLLAIDYSTEYSLFSSEAAEGDLVGSESGRGRALLTRLLAEQTARDSGNERVCRIIILAIALFKSSSCYYRTQQNQSGVFLQHSSCPQLFFCPTMSQRQLSRFSLRFLAIG